MSAGSPDRAAFDAAELRAYVTLFDRLPVGCVQTDRSSAIRRLNDEAVALLHLPRETCVGRLLIGFVARGDCRRFRTLNRSASPETVERARLRFRPRGGPPIVAVDVSVRLVEDGLFWTLQPSLANEASAQAAPSSRRVLYVEDDVDVRQMVEELLVAEGFSVRTAATLHDAKLAVAEMRFDVVLLDYGMPDGDGASFLAWAAADGHLRGCAVAMITGRPDARFPADVPRWAKPIEQSTLGARVRALMSQGPSVAH